MCEYCNITPCNDVVFKIIFTQPGHERILIHFLNCAIKSDTPIKKVTLIDREITPEQIGTKGGRIDIAAETEKGEKINVEMQVNREEFMIKRSLYYWSRNYTNQFKEGDPYENLKRTVCINILNFNLFDDEEFWGIGKLYDSRRGRNMTDDLEIQFIELKKMKHFDKTRPITFWIEFFKDPHSEASQQLYKLVPEIDEAKTVFDRAISNEEVYKKILFREDAFRDYNSVIYGAQKKAREEEQAKAAKEVARLKAQAEKREEKLKSQAEKEKTALKAKAEEEKIKLKTQAEEEKRAEKIEVAKKMLSKGLDISDIADFTNLSIDDIRSL